MIFGSLNNHKFIFKYAAVGIIGFFVEAFIIYLCIRFNLIEINYVRVISFPSAVTATYFLNRSFTFISNNSIKSTFLKYLLSQMIGSTFNLVGYCYLLKYNLFFHEKQIVALGLAAIIGLIVNYGLSLFWVFRKNAELENG